MKIYILFLIVMIVLSCTKKAVFEEYHTTQNEEWCLKDTAKFNVKIPATGDYTINLCLRHTTDYELANLWCFIRASDSTRQVFGDTVNIKVAEADGRWLGNGNTLKQIEQLTNKKVITLPKGEYIFTIEQGMRTHCVKGVKDIGLKIKNISR